LSYDPLFREPEPGGSFRLKAINAHDLLFLTSGIPAAQPDYKAFMVKKFIEPALAMK
jgi:hypothetical protein